MYDEKKFRHELVYYDYFFTQEVKYTYNNNEALSYTRYCCIKTMNITYSKCASVTFYIQHVICGLFVSIIFFQHYFINGTIFGKNVIENKMCALVFSTNFF